MRRVVAVGIDVGVVVDVDDGWRAAPMVLPPMPAAALPPPKSIADIASEISVSSTSNARTSKNEKREMS